MRTIKILILLISMISGYLFGQTENDSSDIIKFSNRIPPDLELEITATGGMAIAFADCFNAKVLQVNRGIFSDTLLLITILPSDKEKYDVISSGDENTVFKIFCMHHKDNEEYNTAYITGFVDSHRTSWRIIDIQKK